MLHRNYSTILFTLVLLSFLACKDISSTPAPSSKPKQVCTECTASLHGSTSTSERCGSEQEVRDFENQYIMGNQVNGATASCERKD